MYFLFQDLLGGITEPCQPIVFFRDVKFSDLYHLVQFIYTGQLDIPVTDLDSFLGFAQSLGVTGFLSDAVNSQLKSPSKRKILDKKFAGVRGERVDKENLRPEVRPGLAESKVKAVTKRRKVLTSLPVNSVKTESESEPLYANTPRPRHQETHSLDSSSFLDPDVLAAKGATLLHHLAVWMIQQRQEQPGQSPHPAVPDQMPSPCLASSLASPHTHSHSLPVRPNTDQERPDSGFDSKDEGGKDKNEDKKEDSPEIREMSRQAVARQPVVKKKRILLPSITKYKL